MEQLRKDSKSKEKKKSVNKVGISSPVSDMEQHCRVLEYTNEVGMLHTMYIYMLQIYMCDMQHMYLVYHQLQSVSKTFSASSISFSTQCSLLVRTA